MRNDQLDTIKKLIPNTLNDTKKILLSIKAL